VACRVVGQPRGTQRYAALLRSDEDALTRDIVTLASQYGRYGYRRITALLNDGWRVGKDRVQRIEPGSPWENGYCESFNGKLRDELFNGEIFYNLKEAAVVFEQWRLHYNQRRPHSSLGYRPPAPQAIEPKITQLQAQPMIH
jgi:transposase InsO family protein